MNTQNYKNLYPKALDFFVKINARKILINPRTLFLIGLYCTKRRSLQKEPQLIQIDDGREAL